MAVDDFSFFDCTIEKIINTTKEKFPRNMENGLVVLPKQRAREMTTSLASDEKFDNPELIAKLKQFSSSGKYERIEGIENAYAAVVYTVTLTPKESKEVDYAKLSMDDFNMSSKLGRVFNGDGAFLKVYLSSHTIGEKQTTMIYDLPDVLALPKIYDLDGVIINPGTDHIQIFNKDIDILLKK